MKCVLARYDSQNPDELVFPGRLGKKRAQIPDSYSQPVEKLKFNKDVYDARDKVVFHTSRRTLASWFVQKASPRTRSGIDGTCCIGNDETLQHLAPEYFKTASMKISGEVDVATSVSTLRS